MGLDKDMELALHQVIQDEMTDDYLDDDIDTFDEEPEVLSFETDAKGNYLRLLPHLIEKVELGARRVSAYQRSELFHESVIETLLDVWCRCRQMYTKLLPGYPYVGIWLDTTQPSIGGFTQKSKRDEQKGTIIECINSGRILTLVTAGLLKKGYFVFCPNAATLGAMQEFRMLTDSVYKICFVGTTGAVWLTDIEVSYYSVANMIVKNLYVQDVLVSTLEGYIPGETPVDDPGERDSDVYEENGSNKAGVDSTDGSDGGTSESYEDGYEEYDEFADDEEDFGIEDDPRLAMMDDIPDDIPDDFL